MSEWMQIGLGVLGIFGLVHLWYSVRAARIIRRKWKKAQRERMESKFWQEFGKLIGDDNEAGS